MPISLVASNIAVRVKNLSKSYQNGNTSIQPLSNISLEIPSESFSAIIGQSGSGKSTLLNIMAGLDRPDCGAVEIGNQNIFDLDLDQLASKRLNDIGIVFQFFNLLPTLTIEDNVAVPCFLKSLPRKLIKQKVAEALEQVNISDLAKKYPHQISGGEIQRAAIARAIINRPSCVFADEPTGNLDPDTAYKVTELFRQIVAINNICLVVVTHDQIVSSQADNVFTLKDGKIANHTINS